VRTALLLLAVGSCGCAPAVPVALARADARFNARAWSEAQLAFDTVATRRDATLAERARALTGAAQACDRLNDMIGARARLEDAVAHEVPGVTEPALFYLAEHLRVSDRARALSLYYRAAAGAEKRGGGFPYRAAMDRIVQLSVSP
jgi:hypothetical protein